MGRDEQHSFSVVGHSSLCLSFSCFQVAASPGLFLDRFKHNLFVKDLQTGQQESLIVSAKIGCQFCFNFRTRPHKSHQCSSPHASSRGGQIVFGGTKVPFLMTGGPSMPQFQETV